MQINTTSDALDNLNKKLGGADIEIEPSTNKVDALKKIYKTLGGTDDVKGLSTVYQVLEKITEVAEGGGGGGGDFSTAIATVQITGETFFEIPLINDGISAAGIVQSGTYIIPLYKGKAFAHCADLAEITGNITGESGDFVITGDFTISITTGD